jgi:hypothetical protein
VLVRGRGNQRRRGEHTEHRRTGCGLSAPSQHLVPFSGQVGHRKVGRKGGVFCLAGPTPLSAPLHVVVVAVPSRASRVVTRAGVNIVTWFSRLLSTQHSAPLSQLEVSRCKVWYLQVIAAVSLTSQTVRPFLSATYLASLIMHHAEEKEGQMLKCSQRAFHRSPLCV